MSSNRLQRVSAGKLLLVTVVVGLIWWVVWRRPSPWYAEIRLPTSDENIPLDWIRRGSETSMNPRNIATITSCFTRSTWIDTGVFAVEDGQTVLVDNKTIGRSSSSSRPGDPYLMTLNVKLALADDDWGEGRTTLLISRGHSRSFGNFGGIHKDFDAITSKTFVGRINPGESRLLYVEGDRSFDATPLMTMDDFAAANTVGNFLVVMVGFSR